MIRTISTLIISFLFFPRIAWAAPTINISSYPPSAVAGQEFDVSFDVSGADSSVNYYAKALGGEGLNEVDIWNGSWLQQNDAWTSMPVFLTNTESSASASVKARFDPDTQSGTKEFKIRIRKEGTDTNNDSSVVSIAVAAATPSPTPAPTQAPTAAPTAVPTAAPIKTPTPVPTKSPTPKATKTPMPEPEVLGEANTSEEPKLTSEVNKDSSGAGLDSPEVSSSGKRNIFLPIIFIASGVGMIGFAVYNLVRARKNPVQN